MVKLQNKASTNRANAKSSTGPRSAAGKKRSSKNAMRHGLATPIHSDPSWQDRSNAIIQELVNRSSTDEERRVCLEIAAQQCELLRVRGSRRQLIDTCHQTIRLHPPPSKILGVRLSRDIIKLSMDLGDPVEVADNLTRQKPYSEEENLIKAIKDMSSRITRIDRYERRAHSRLGNAVRRLDEMRAKSSNTPASTSGQGLQRPEIRPNEPK